MSVDCKVMSEIENEVRHSYRLMTEDLGMINEFREEIETADKVTIDNQFTATIVSVEIENYENYAIIELNLN